MASPKKDGVTRRTFIESATTGAAAIAAMTHGPAVWAAGYSPNETIGIAHIGIGVRGGQLIVETAGEPEKERPGIPNTKVLTVCDIYNPHMEKAAKLSANPDVKRVHNYEDVLADKDIDAVVVAVPDHSHSPIVIAAANAGKDIYIEKCWSRTVPEVKAMYKAIKENNTVMQLGHDSRDSAAIIQAREVIKTGVLGPITFVRTGIFRNRPLGKDEWRWYGWYSDFDRPDETMVRENLDWDRFIGSAPYHPFSMERFWHWRCYWDYGTGIAGDLLSHSFDFTNAVLELGIPHSCSCSGQNNLLKDGREAPDTWNTLYEYPDKNLSLVWTSTFNSMAEAPGPFDVDIRGKDALMKMAENDFAVYVEEVSNKYRDKIDSGKIKTGEPFIKFDPKETPEQPSHMQDFFNCMRSRKKPKDNEDEAFAEAITCIMSVESYFKKRTVYWDAERQEIV
ncbi:MAG: hypothetical protein GC154_04725 [bacterium]|nr:hypothetical protein [bacterium]